MTLSPVLDPMSSSAPAQRRDHYALACFRQWLLETASLDPDVMAAGAPA